MNHSANPSAPGRQHWLDNLRTAMIFCVVLYHVGGVYESAGLWGWFWIVDDPTTMVWVGIMGIVFDIFVMPLMFLVSGYLAVGQTAAAVLDARVVVPLNSYFHSELEVLQAFALPDKELVRR